MGHRFENRTCQDPAPGLRTNRGLVGTPTPSETRPANPKPAPRLTASPHTGPAKNPLCRANTKTRNSYPRSTQNAVHRPSNNNNPNPKPHLSRNPNRPKERGANIPTLCVPGRTQDYLGGLGQVLTGDSRDTGEGLTPAFSKYALTGVFLVWLIYPSLSSLKHKRY